MSVHSAEFRCSRSQCGYEVAVRHAHHMAGRIGWIDECPVCGAELDIVGDGGS